MSLILCSHPYSAYGQKASVALYDLGLPFELKLVEARSPPSGPRTFYKIANRQSRTPRSGDPGTVPPAED